MTKVIDLDNEGEIIDITPSAEEISSIPTTASDRFRSGMLEQSQLAQIAEKPFTALEGLRDAAAAAGGDPIKMISQGMLSQVLAGLSRAKENFGAIPLNADLSTQRGAAAQTLMSALPVVGRYVEPMRESIPSDPRQPVDVPRIAGNVAGSTLDAAVGAGMSRLPGAVAASGARRAAATEAAITKATAKAAADRLRRTNTVLGIKPKDLDAGGFNLDNMYDPAGHIIREGIDVTAQTRPGSYAQISDLMDTFKKQVKQQLAATSNAGHARNVRRATKDLRTAVKEAKKLSSPLHAEMKEAYDDVLGLVRGKRIKTGEISLEGPVTTRGPAPLGPILSGTDMETVIGRLNYYINKYKRNEVYEPLTRPLMSARSELRKIQTANSGTGVANKHLRELGRAKRSLKREILKERAAGVPRDATVIPPEGGMNIPAALRTVGTVAGMAGVPVVPALARGSATIGELLARLMRKGAE